LYGSKIWKTTTIKKLVLKSEASKFGPNKFIKTLILFIQLFESKAEIQSIGIKEFKSKNRKRQTPEEMYSSDAFTTLSFAKLKR
jgi:hypothetical protein